MQREKNRCVVTGFWHGPPGTPMPLGEQYGACQAAHIFPFGLGKFVRFFLFSLSNSILDSGAVSINVSPRAFSLTTRRRRDKRC